MAGKLPAQPAPTRLQAVVGSQESSLHHIQAGVYVYHKVASLDLHAHVHVHIRYSSGTCTFVNDCEDTLPAGAELATYADDTSP